MSENITGPTPLLENFTERFKNNDEQVLKYMYVTNYAKIENYVISNSGTIDEAKDIYQEAFIVVWRNVQLNKVSFDTADSVNGYLFKVAQYKWIDELRRKGKKKIQTLTGTEVIADIGPATSKEENAYLEKVKIHFATVGTPCKEVLKRFYFLKQSMAEIASNFSWTEATAKNNKYRCLQKLRSMVQSINK
jgi:RNA polymerase sigma factor (sigma-70 family)